MSFMLLKTKILESNIEVLSVETKEKLMCYDDNPSQSSIKNFTHDISKKYWVLILEATIS